MMELRAVLAILVGAVLLLWPRSLSATASSKHAQRLKELRAGSEKTIFEERRSLEAYHPPRREWPWRLLGGALLMSGLWMIFGRT
jgi:hypothetical protein